MLSVHAVVTERESVISSTVSKVAIDAVSQNVTDEYVGDCQFYNVVRHPIAILNIALANFSEIWCLGIIPQFHIDTTPKARHFMDGLAAHTVQQRNKLVFLCFLGRKSRATLSLDVIQGFLSHPASNDGSFSYPFVLYVQSEVIQKK